MGSSYNIRFNVYSAKYSNRFVYLNLNTEQLSLLNLVKDPIKLSTLKSPFVISLELYPSIS